MGGGIDTEQYRYSRLEIMAELVAVEDFIEFVVYCLLYQLLVLLLLVLVVL